MSQTKTYIGEILLVEDNDVNQLVATKYLQRMGLHPDIASNGQEAVDKAKEKAYDLIFMDLQMPEKNGYDAAKEIRLISEHYQQIPIIALTAASFMEIAEKIKEAGIDEFIHKPFSPEEIKQLVAKYLPPGDEPQVNKLSVIYDHLISSRLNALADGDQDFLHELTRLYISSIMELQEQFCAHLLDRDLNRLRDIRHKHKANLELLSLNQLSALLDEGKSLLLAGEMDKVALHRVIDAIKQHTEAIGLVLKKTLQ
jgi:CheY-like chemotaxis protein/HPt (histidine-containing phosphotransfer) domain-containing protein